jgi:hypothetical protein
MAACPNCGFSNESGEKLCGGCGVALAPISAHAEKPDGQLEAPGAAPQETPESGSGTDEETERQRCLTLFIRENVDVYLEFYDKYIREGGKSQLVFSWHWPAVLIPLVWLLYRKLYLWAVGFLLAVVFVNLALLLMVSKGVADTVVSLAVPAILAIFAKRIYVSHALRRIRKIDERNLAPAERDSYLERAGGVSIPGAVFGLIVMFSLMVLPSLVGQ